ncbi:hypothetical protein [Micromonospora sp. LOL_024]|uniref:hypothetical protein n=1 Tax=Micromonospora sp. LOL_024 TaxID=3345412 RepID=UPI003A8755A5
MASTGAGSATSPGRVSGWLSSDRIRAAALAMIALSVLWRAQVASRGFLAADDYVMITQAAESDLTVEHLLSLYNNHLMPGGRMFTWLVTEHVGMAYWPYVLLMAIGQTILGITFLRLLRRLLQPSWLLLLPLGALMFSPLTLEATSWWAVGVNVLPMQIAMVLAVGAQVGYVQTRRRRHLVALALSVLLGLFFFEKAILVVALVFLLTAALYAEGGPIRTIWSTVRRWWPSWLLLTVLSLGFLAAYLGTSESSLRRPTSAGEVFSFLSQMLGSTVVAGLVGGPWQWLGAGDGAPVAAPPELGTWVGWAILAALVVATVRRRRRAGRAWLLLGAYLLLVAGMLAATRLGSSFSGVAGGVPRYVSDAVVVAAICLGVTVVGLARPSSVPAEIEPPDEAEPPAGGALSGTPDLVQKPIGAPVVPAPPPVRSTQPALVVSRPGVIHAEAPDDLDPNPASGTTPDTDSPKPEATTTRATTAAAHGAAEPPSPGPLGPLPERYREAVHVMLALVLVAVCLGTVWTTSGYSDKWAAKSGRSYVDTVRIEMASAPPDTVFFDGPVPSNVVPDLSWPYNLQSRFFRAFGARPTYVDEADNVSVLDSLGRIQVATIVGSTIQPGPQEGCGYLVTTGQTARMPLDEPRDDWHWVVRIGYLSSADGTATLRFGTGSAEFPVRKGLNQRFFRIVGGGDTVELAVAGTDVSLCTNEIAIGNPALKPE